MNFYRCALLLSPDRPRVHVAWSDAYEFCIAIAGKLPVTETLNARVAVSLEVEKASSIVTIHGNPGVDRRSAGPAMPLPGYGVAGR